MSFRPRKSSTITTITARTCVGEFKFTIVPTGCSFKAPSRQQIAGGLVAMDLHEVSIEDAVAAINLTALGVCNVLYTLIHVLPVEKHGGMVEDGLDKGLREALSILAGRN